MKTINTCFFLPIIFLFANCSNNSAENDTTIESKTVQAEDPGIEVTTVGYEGRIEGPASMQVEGISSYDLQGTMTKKVLVEFKDSTGYTGFYIERSEKNLDSLKGEVEQSNWNEFVSYAEESDQHYIAKITQFMNADTLYVVGVVISKNNVNYIMVPEDEYTTLIAAQEIANCALSYKPN